MKSVKITLENLVKTYFHQVKGSVNAVNNISLEVNPGELLTLLGPSGCGKTTTMRMIGGFEEPDSGKIFIGDEDVTGAMANKRDAGFVFQNYALFPHLSVYENVAYGLKIRKYSKAEIDQMVEDVLAKVKLEGYANQFPHQMSGGEQQRIALARAIVVKPKVLLLDEPLSNLDAKLRISTRSEIRRLQKSLSISTVYVTHDQEEAMAISDRIVVMNKGNIIQIGTADELYFNPATEFVAKFIGKINAIPSTVKNVSEIDAEVLVGDTGFRVTHLKRKIKVGDKVDILIRPEAVTITGGSESSKMKGTITEKVFLGDRVDYMVDYYGTNIQISSFDPIHQGKFEIGQTVEIVPDPERVKILEE